jgi:NAD(P) transhydrogenase subunit beta
MLAFNAATEQVAYMVAALFFIFGLKRLSGVRTARQGNLWAALGMAAAIAITLLLVQAVTWWVLIGGVLAGTIVGWLLATRVQMTAMPELVALFNGLGGAASALVALAEVARFEENAPASYALTGETYAFSESGVSVSGGATFAVAIGLSILIGAVTLSGSMIAYAKLAGKIWKNRFGPIGSQGLNVGLALASLGLLVWGCFLATGGSIVLACLLLTAAALVLGVGLVMPIGGADMPVVISLLNSYSGMAASATGFVLHNNLLIIAGSLVGASGLILTKIMCKAMNRSLTNVLFATFGEQEGGAKKDDGYANVKSSGPEECALLLEAAQSVIIVPGYGLAVAQAQHKVREMASMLQKKGCRVSYAIHPVAGRMPGHMNVLLAEADVPYEQLFDLDQINGEFKNTDVAIVLGANDVCNPIANTDPKSPIAGMPVLSVWEAQTVMVVKRSLSAGYSGIKNPLFEGSNPLMVFGDAKKVVDDLVTELKGL